MDATTFLSQLDALTPEIINQVPLENLIPQIGTAGLGFGPEHDCNAGREHYRFLYHISSWFDNITIFEIGTGQGGSALCLAQNPNNTVVTYDYANRLCVVKPDNVECIIGDNYLTDPRLLTSPLIFFDKGNHDGVLEKEFYDFLVDNNYKGITLWDDIGWTVGVRNFWDSVTKTKRDVTNLGHSSGTGIIVFE